MTNTPKTSEESQRFEELLPCPFCGSQPTYEPRVRALDRVNYWPEMVKCEKCRLYFRSDDNQIGNDAVKFWNTRSNPDLTALRAKCEELEKIAMERIDDRFSEANSENMLKMRIERLIAGNTSLRQKVEELEKRVEEMAEKLGSAVKELRDVTVIKDGHPNVSHGLMYNLHSFLSAYRATSDTVSAEVNAKSKQITECPKCGSLEIDFPDDCYAKCVRCECVFKYA